MERDTHVVVILNEVVVPQWIYRCIENINNSGHARVTSLISPKQVSLDQNWPKRSRGGLLFANIFDKIDSFLFSDKNNSQIKRDISALVPQVSLIDLKSKTGSYDETNGAIKRSLENLKPDVVILFGSHHIETETLSIPRFGFWTLSIDSNDAHGGPQFGFREVIKHQPLTDTVLEVKKADGSGSEVLYCSRESTYLYSVTVNRNRVFWRATHVVPRIIEGLWRNGDEYLTHLKERNKRFQISLNRFPYSGSLIEILSDLTKHIGKLLLLGFNKVFYTDAFSWRLLTSIMQPGNIFSQDFGAYNSLTAPGGKFWADPFVIAVDQIYYLFVEEFIYRKNKAHISVIQLDKSGKFIRSDRILERPYHMSYPFTFKIDDIWYMIPETGQNRTIELYKCKEFPYKWDFDRYIMQNISATDATLFLHENKWWLFTTVDQTNGISGGSTELHLFYSDDIFSGNWISHPLNPVVADESSARCAGRLFVREGEIYRPSQDCSVRYGRGIKINHVTTLNTYEYNEIEVEEIRPDWDQKLKGTHTLNTDGGFTVIDVYTFHGRISLNN